MKLCIVNLTLCMCICVYSSAIYAEGSSKQFLDYYCSITLPDETWAWDENIDIPNILAMAESSDGYLLLFGACAYQGNYPVNDKFISGLEKGRLNNPSVVKKAGKKITYCDVPCYELKSFTEETNMNSITRFFNGHGYSYYMEILYPQNYEMEETQARKIWGGFVFTKIPTYKSVSEHNSANQEGEYIGRVVGHVLFWAILLYIIYAVVKKFFVKIKKN